MNDNEDLDFKIGIIGPTRVGKTSLIASILKDSRKLLEGTPLKINPRGTPTERRIAQHHKELDGSLRAGEFHPGAVQGTEEPFTFQLHLDPGVEGEGINLNILDYPGGWLDPDRRPLELEKEWNNCKRWMTESTVLLIPIESAVLMEAERSLQRKALPSILTTYEVEDVARDWAKNRAQRSDEPALLLLCPVKCESYFTDNGGLRDKSKDLFLEVCDTYRGVIESVKGEARQVRILYAPIDTIGCVEIIQANWKEAKNAPGGFEFTADYRVRSPGRQAIKGADAVLVSLCKILVAARKQVLAMEAGEKQKEADLAKVFAEKNEGFFKNIWLQLNGERKRRIGQANLTSSEAIRQQNAVKCMQETIEVLAKRDLGARVHEL